MNFSELSRVGKVEIRVVELGSFGKQPTVNQRQGGKFEGTNATDCNLESLGIQVAGTKIV